MLRLVAYFKVQSGHLTPEIEDNHEKPKFGPGPAEYEAGVPITGPRISETGERGNKFGRSLPTVLTPNDT
jgi:hypothetical protein